MKVHNTLGNGFQEVIYQRCLAIELSKANLEFVREKDQIIFYEGEEVGTRRADFIVEGNIMVELKALINWKMYILRKLRIMLWLTICQPACLLILGPPVYNIKKYSILSIIIL